MIVHTSRPQVLWTSVHLAGASSRASAVAPLSVAAGAPFFVFERLDMNCRLAVERRPTAYS